MWGNPRGFRLDGALATILFISATVYGLVWVPDLVRQSPDPNEIHNFNDVVYRQYTMFEYHDKLVATHPYSSKWWEWPLDYVPIAYYYQDHRKDQNDHNGCCVEEITSMPNPFIMWFGLIAVPIVGVLAWLRKNKAYALIVLTYLLQWLPWMKSPRITFAYHFYVDIPLICLCNAIVLQQLWAVRKRGRQRSAVGRSADWRRSSSLVAGAFVFFYPILAAVPISWEAMASAGCGFQPGSSARDSEADHGAPESKRLCMGTRKWHNIKLDKGKTDAQRGALFTRLSREITLCGQSRLARSRGQSSSEDRRREGARKQHAL